MKRKIITLLNSCNQLLALYITALTILQFSAFHRIGYILLAITLTLQVILTQQWKSIVINKMSWFYIFLLMFFSLAIIYAPFEQSHKYFNLLVNRRLPILFFGLIGLFSIAAKFKVSYFLNAFIATSVFAIAYLVLIKIDLPLFISSANKSDLFAIERIKYINNHMVFNFYLNVSLVGIWFILKNSWSKIHFSLKIYYFASAFMILSALSISEGRSGFFAACLLMLSFVFLEIWERAKKLRIVIGLILPFLLIGLLSTHERISPQRIKNEPRYFLWESGVKVIKDSPIWGNGISDAQEKYDTVRDTYQSEDYKIFTKNLRLSDCHNQYIQTTMEFGIIGIVLLLFLYSAPLLIAHKKRKLLVAFFLFLCINQSMFDMFITGHFSTLFGILMVMAISMENDLQVEASI